MEKNNRRCFTVVRPLDLTENLLGICLTVGIDSDVGREGWVVIEKQPVGANEKDVSSIKRLHLHPQLGHPRQPRGVPL